MTKPCSQAVEPKPGQPEADGIRYLRGTKALAYLKAIDANDCQPNINRLTYILLEVRRRLMELIGMEIGYFPLRHLHDNQHRRFLDIYYFYTIDEMKSKGERPIMTPLCYWRYRYLKRKYKTEFSQSYDWSMVTKRQAKRPVFVWHEDIDYYHALHI